MTLFQNIKGIETVIVQEKLSYADVLRKLKPAIVVHGDDWREGVQRKVREEVTSLLAEYGGRLVEFPYDQDHRFVELEQRLAKAML